MHESLALLHRLKDLTPDWVNCVFVDIDKSYIHCNCGGHFCMDLKGKDSHPLLCTVFTCGESISVSVYRNSLESSFVRQKYIMSIVGDKSRELGYTLEERRFVFDLFSEVDTVALLDGWDSVFGSGVREFHNWVVFRREW